MKINIILLFIIAIITTSCNSDDEGVNNDCQGFTSIPPASGFGYHIIADSNSIETPYVNPNNPNEFCYCVWQPYNNKYSLCVRNTYYKYNRILKKDIKLYGQPKWNKNNYIIFTQAPGNIWRINSDGSNLVQLTNSNDDFYPEWINHSDTFITEVFSPGGCRLYDINGRIIKTLKNSFGSGQCSSNGNYIISSCIRGIIILDIVHDTFYDYNLNWYYNNLTNEINICVLWLDKENFIWLSDIGIFHSNIKTKEDIKIACSSNAHYYMWPSLSEKNNKIILEKMDYQIIDTQTLYGSTSVVRMDPDGKNMEIIYHKK